ncbi:Uncharacterized protein Rs2_23681 [Raphanus sativus]|nr:Uncharacterized protein Rs2_23681 [Raphanus sativus]
MLTHEAKECPLHFDDDANNSPPPEQDNDDNDDNDEPPSPMMDNGDAHVGDVSLPPQTADLYTGLEPMSPDFPKDTSNANQGQNRDDHDLAIETVRYLQSKMAKGKFTSTDFMKTFAEYTRQEESPRNNKRTRYDREFVYPNSYVIANGTDLSPVNNYAYDKESQGSWSPCYAMDRGAEGPVPPGLDP